jgi:8-oxo-dGTP diphosphatase
MKEKILNFNIRTYGFLVNDAQEVLISHEREYGMEFSKFPGGGVELGEGITDALKREFVEECGIDISILRHVYTTEEFVLSEFNQTQVIAIYYLVHAAESELAKISMDPLPAVVEPAQAFKWISIKELDSKSDLTFDIDKKSWQVFLASL